MKRVLLALTGLALSAATAYAADLAPSYVKTPAPVQATYSWTGFYIGGNVGGGMASTHFDDPNWFGSTATPTRGFFTGGAQVGYNYQFGAGLIGIEADVNGNSAFKNSFLGGLDENGMILGIKADVSGTIRARLGLVVSNAMVYVTGGAAWADYKQTGTGVCNQSAGCRTNSGIDPLGAPSGITANSSGTIWGGVVGAGVEYALSRNWTVGGEFLHTMYQDRDTLIVFRGISGCGNVLPAANCVLRNQLTTDVARLRFNYKFGDGGAIVARY